MGLDVALLELGRFLHGAGLDSSWTDRMVTIGCELARRVSLSADAQTPRLLESGDLAVFSRRR